MFKWPLIGFIREGFRIVNLQHVISIFFIIVAGAHKPHFGGKVT